MLLFKNKYVSLHLLINVCRITDIDLICIIKLKFKMKKLLLIGIAVAMSSFCHAQKVEYEQAQARILEPLQEVLVRPMAAEMKMLSTELKVYSPSWQFKEKKLTDMTVADLDNAKANAVFHACIADGADIILAATYYIRNHIDEKGKASDYGVDVIVRGYPAKYEKWHLLGDPKYTTDDKWVSPLIEAQRVRALKNDSETKAMSNQTRTK